MRIVSEQLLSSGDMSASITTNSQNLIQMAIACVQAIYSGSPNGSLQLQISNDNLVWSNYLTPATITTSGNSVWNIEFVGFQWLRAVYTKSSGTGSLSISVSGKG